MCRSLFGAGRMLPTARVLFLVPTADLSSLCQHQHQVDQCNTENLYDAPTCDQRVPELYPTCIGNWGCSLYLYARRRFGE